MFKIQLFEYLWNKSSTDFIESVKVLNAKKEHILKLNENLL